MGSWPNRFMVIPPAFPVKMLNEVTNPGITPALHSVVNPRSAGVHAPVSSANDAAPPVNAPIHGGPGVLIIGVFAAVVRSKMRVSHVTEKAVKVWVTGSYVNDPAVGRIPVPVKSIVYMVPAMAAGAQKAAMSITLDPICIRFMG